MFYTQEQNAVVKYIVENICINNSENTNVFYYDKDENYSCFLELNDENLKIISDYIYNYFCLKLTSVEFNRHINEVREKCTYVSILSTFENSDNYFNYLEIYIEQLYLLVINLISQAFISNEKKDFIHCDIMH